MSPGTYVSQFQIITIPGDDWGVLGPTTCPLCRTLRKSPAFAVTLILIGAWMVKNA